MPSLGTSFGRGASTMAMWDLANSDCVIVMGSNMAENHPVAFRFLVQAKDRGATLIHVDPRFSRTSALSDLYVPIRSGSDIAFLGGVIRHILENDLWFKEYALAYTNLSAIVSDEFKDTDELDGVFSGWSEENGCYKVESWQYENQQVPAPTAEHHVTTTETLFGARSTSQGPPPTDETLQHPYCVYQIMRRHYARYTPEMVERVTGCPRDAFLQVCDALARNSGRERTTAFCYAVGWTHHSNGVQIIRACSIIQALLGNIGRPGGGITALRGHCSIQGSTDIPTLYNMLPTYLAQPQAFKPHQTLKDFLEHETVRTGWWYNFPKYMISLLRAWYGDNARPDNDWAYGYLPKLTGDHSQQPTTLTMVDGAVKGMFVLGQNPVVGAVNSDLVERGLARLDWLVVRDYAETETASFWREGRIVRRGEMRTEEIGTEVFFMPCAMAAEKDGSMTSTSRLVQWHDKCCEAPGDSRSETWFMYHLGRRLKALYAGSDDPKDAPIKALTWDYPVRGEKEEPDAAAILREINGYTWPEKKQVASFQELRDDGSTACGGWLYSGIFPTADHNQARSRIPDGPDGPGSHLGWAFTWPANRRTMYNRASADPSGKPWSERKKMIWWDERQAKWTGLDVPDFEIGKRPDYQPEWSKNPTGMAALSGADPFIMLDYGRSMVFVPTGLKDGPLPSHYEPIESPVKNALYGRQHNPPIKYWPRPGNEYHPTGDQHFPYVLTTYRLTELHCGGIPSRVTPHTAELQPEAFVEIPPELAQEHGIRNLDWVVLSTARGEIEVKAMITARLRPFVIDGKPVYQIGMPWVYGWEGYARGDIANVLISAAGDPNTSIHETKALTCNLRRGRVIAEAAE